MKIRLNAKTSRGAAALAGATAYLLEYMEAEADEADLDDGQGNASSLIIDNLRLRLNADPDEADSAKDKHDASLTVELKPGKRGHSQNRAARTA